MADTHSKYARMQSREEQAKNYCEKAKQVLQQSPLTDEKAQYIVGRPAREREYKILFLCGLDQVRDQLSVELLTA